MLVGPQHLLRGLGACPVPLLTSPLPTTSPEDCRSARGDRLATSCPSSREMHGSCCQHACTLGQCLSFHTTQGISPTGAAHRLKQEPALLYEPGLSSELCSGLVTGFECMQLCKWLSSVWKTCLLTLELDGHGADSWGKWEHLGQVECQRHPLEPRSGPV